MNHADGLDLVRLVGRQPRLDLLEVGAMAPVAGNEIHFELELLGDAAPQHGELPGLRHQHLVAGLQRIDEGRLPGAGAGRRVDDDRLLGAKHPLHGRQHGMTDLGEFGTAMVHGRHVHGAQHPVRHVGRSRNLQKMPSSMHGHGRPSRYSLGFATVEYHYLAGLSPARRRPSMHKERSSALPSRTPAGKRLTSIQRDHGNGGNRGRKTARFGRNLIPSPATKETIHG